jgi:hypothetical protein
MSGNISADDWSHWQQQFCHSYYYEYQSQMQNSNLAQVFSDNAKSVVETCLNREPVYAYFDVSPSGDAFAFTFHVQGKDKLKKGFVRPGNAVKDCDIDNPSACRGTTKTLVIWISLEKGRHLLVLGIQV